MKCEKCGKEYPSHYYFEVELVCNDCFKALNDEEKEQLYKSRKSKYSKDEASNYDIHGNPLICPICAYDKFWIRKTLMNTPGATFLGVEWANKQADNYICNHCGHVTWFLRE